MSSFENAQSTEAVTAGQSRDWLYTISIVLVVIGIFISGYLSYVKLTDVPMVCVAGSVFKLRSRPKQCLFTTIQYSHCVARFCHLSHHWSTPSVTEPSGVLREYGVMIQFGIILFAFLFSMWLVYVQFFRLQALCMWCLSHELNMTILFIVSIVRLKRSLATE